MTKLSSYKWSHHPGTQTEQRSSSSVGLLVAISESDGDSRSRFELTTLDSLLTSGGSDWLLRSICLLKKVPEENQHVEHDPDVENGEVERVDLYSHCPDSRGHAEAELPELHLSDALFPRTRKLESGKGVVTIHDDMNRGVHHG